MVTYEYTSSMVNPTVVDWDIIPEYRTEVSEFGSGKKVRNQKWTNPRYKFKIKYRTPMRAVDIEGIKDFYIARQGQYESFQLYCTPLGTTHTVTFDIDNMGFNYNFKNLLSQSGVVAFTEEIS
jgi:hypothetical protein